MNLKDTRKKLFPETVIMHWHRLLREVVESLFLEELKKCADVALTNMVRELGGDALMSGLDDLSGLSELNGSRRLSC